MCGLAGFINKNLKLSSNAEEIILQMTDAISHRGPDDYGIWFDRNFGIALGHRRLSILDLSSAGHQPMLSHNGRYRLIFNGEIYNHMELRQKIPYPWRGSSDTETLLACFEIWGIEETIKKCVGMFAFAIFDLHRECLILGRDRIGEKPLYYGWQGSANSRVFLFASDLDALKRHPSFNADIDRDSLCLFLRYGYIPAPYSIYRNIKKLEAGKILTLSVANLNENSVNYWCIDSSIRNQDKSFFKKSTSDVIRELDLLLNVAIQRQTISDVPLGVSLSSGIDSSLISAISQAQSVRPIQSFTIGFNEMGYDEASFAKDIAAHIGTAHNEVYVSPKQVLEIVPLLPKVYSEPFADSSQIPTILLAKLASNNVSVLLTGDGGDELFCGYNRYAIASNLWPILSKFPVRYRQLIAKIFLSVKPTDWDIILSSLRFVLPKFLFGASRGDFFHKGLSVLDSKNIQELHSNLLSRWKNPESVVIGGFEPNSHLDRGAIKDSVSYIQDMMLQDLKSYLPNDILVKNDRATMAFSLESRAPYLDHTVVEYAFNLPSSFKLRQGIPKWILREVLYRYIPKKFVDRPKMGFSVPIAEWLRGPLKDWASELLSENKLHSQGYFRPEIIRAKWLEHLSGKRNWQDSLWNVLMFQAWLEVNK